MGFLEVDEALEYKFWGRLWRVYYADVLIANHYFFGDFHEFF